MDTKINKNTPSKNRVGIIRSDKTPPNLLDLSYRVRRISDECKFSNANKEFRIWQILDATGFKLNQYYVRSSKN